MIQTKRYYELVTGILGIYVCYLSLGVIQESILKGQYENDTTHQKEKFIWPSGTLIIPHGLTWFFASIINRLTIPANETVNIPQTKSAVCGLTVAVSTLTYSYAILYTNFPVVMMFKSCNLISVLLVGVLCQKIRNKKMKLGTNKLVIGVIITLGTVLFNFFDPASSKKLEKQTQIIGAILLIISLLADGFLPDFQAQLKTAYKPRPMQMLAEINKWIFIFSYLYSGLLFELVDIFLFMWNHKMLSIHLYVYSLCAFVGQLFVYLMIKQFTQHFVPFVITTRKIFTVGLSILFYGHETNAGQIIGLLLVFGLVIYEFISDLAEEQQQKQIKIQQIAQLNQDSFADNLNTQADLEIKSQSRVLDELNRVVEGPKRYIKQSKLAIEKSNTAQKQSKTAQKQSKTAQKQLKTAQPQKPSETAQLQLQLTKQQLQTDKKSQKIENE